MDKVRVSSSEEVGSNDKLEDSLDVDGCGESDESGIVSFDWIVNGRELELISSVVSLGKFNARVEDVRSEPQVSVSDVSEINDTDVKDADRGVPAGVQVDKSDREDVVNEESRDFDSGISLTVQTSVVGVSSTAGTAINGVDFGVLVNVQIFCSCVAWSVL